MASSGLKTRLKALEVALKAKGDDDRIKLIIARSQTDTHYVLTDGSMIAKDDPSINFVIISDADRD